MKRCRMRGGKPIIIKKGKRARTTTRYRGATIKCEREQLLDNNKKAEREIENSYYLPWYPPARPNQTKPNPRADRHACENKTLPPLPPSDAPMIVRMNDRSRGMGA